MPIQLDLPSTLFAVASIPLNYYSEVMAMLQNINGFVSVTRDKDEITLILAENQWHEVAVNFPGSQVQLGRRMIRFDTVLDFSVVGFIAEISRALADADISILSLSTYRTDAVLVHEAKYEKALVAVRHALVTLQLTVLAQH
ncbi:MAG: ACT domain-containing protein [Acidobacteria bacterium]|nr:ACT domain-containing protein [Acidobacteriota bacterium]